MRFSQSLGTSGLAGAEGLGLRSRSGQLAAERHWRSLPPSARGFGVDVGESSRERGSPSVTRFPPQARKRTVLVWCCGEIIRAKRQSNSLFEGVLHHGAGLVQLTGVQVDAGGWIAVPVQIPDNRIVENGEALSKDDVVPQGGEHAAFFQQGRGVVGADAPSLS